jgi:2-polyprenyl-3-methyl-5-hydroxy-6-metoxy-1,4-benzoquinol methylase
MRGVEQTLLLIGNSGTTQPQLRQMIRKRKIKKHALLVNELTNPYRHIGGQPINLVSSIVEPFGLTVVESLSRGIPVVSSRCGGPEEILPDEYIYDAENYDQCVKILERVWENYAASSGEAVEIFNKIAARNTTEKRSAILSAAIGKAHGTHCDSFDKQLRFTVPHTDLISASEILKHIQMAADSRGIEIGTHDIESMIANEQREPGFAIRGDVEKFDITPFAHSRKMDELYRGGIGLGIELATYHQDSGKSKMLNFILLGIREMQSASKDPLKILCLGDGLGLDSITIAASGFQVDYMDYDNSVMSECARLNLKKAMSVDRRIAINVINKVKAAYDCIVCLEVIEHVPDPMSFMTFISDCLNEKGVLYLSECFNGIDVRWPTHLYSNEKFSHSILDVSEAHFALTDINQDPMLKPLVFRKKNSVYKSSNQLSGAKRHAFLQHNARLFLGK